jgi:hypothetical protein
MPAAELYDLGLIHIPVGRELLHRRFPAAVDVPSTQKETEKNGERGVGALSHLVSRCDMFDYSPACNTSRRLPARMLALNRNTD